MRNEITTFIAACVVLFTLTSPADDARAEDEKPEWMPEVSAGVAFESQYIWRGQTLVDNFVLQPEGSISLYGLTFSVWGNYDVEDLERFTEFDYVIDYTFNIGDLRETLGSEENLEFIDPLSISAGYTFYTFPNLSGDDFDSHEFYVGASYDWIISPFFTYYYDFDSGDGSYFEFGGSYSYMLPGDVELATSATAGYNAGQWGYSSSFSNLLFSGEVNIPILKYFTVSPNANYSLALDDQYDNEFYAGVKISVSY